MKPFESNVSSLTSHICFVKEPNVRKLNLAGTWQETHWKAILKTWFYSHGKFVKKMMLSYDYYYVIIISTMENAAG